MQVFLVSKSSKTNIFKRIETKGDKIILNCDISKMKLAKKIRYTKKVAENLRKNNSNMVILSKKLKADENFQDLLISNQINIVTGQELYKVLIEDIIEEIILKNNIESKSLEIAITTNSKGEWINNLIKNLSKKYKNIKLISNNITYFKRLEEQLLQDEGIILTVSNNKRKAMLKSNIIVNVDFPEEVINKYNIYDKSIIVNLEEKIKINKKRLCGKIINNYNLKLKENSDIYKDLVKDENKEFDLKDLVECYLKNKPEEIKNVAVSL